MLAKGCKAAMHERTGGDVPNETNKIAGAGIQQAKWKERDRFELS
jgi:hypothetical protein